MTAKITNYLFIIASTILLISAALYISDDPMVFKIMSYSYAISGATIAVIYLSNRYNGSNFRLKRLNIQQVIAALLLPASSYFMFKHRNEWFMLLLISVFLQMYIVIIKSVEEKKEKKEKRAE